jgi:hypothetical protein
MGSGVRSGERGVAFCPLVRFVAFLAIADLDVG